jgi:hypothetical protein
VGDTNNYSDCTACTSTYDLKHDGDSYFYCTDYCPSGWDASGGGSSCVLPTDKKVLSYLFNAPTVQYGNSGSAGSDFDVQPNLEATNGSGSPAKDRGLYFNGSAAAPGYVNIPGLQLSHTFAVHSWVLLKATGATQTIFSKDRNVFTASDKNLLLLTVNTDNKM